MNTDSQMKKNCYLSHREKLLTIVIYRLTFDIKTFITLVEEAPGRSSCRNSCDLVILNLKLCYSTAKIKK